MIILLSINIVLLIASTLVVLVYITKCKKSIIKEIDRLDIDEEYRTLAAKAIKNHKNQHIRSAHMRAKNKWREKGS